MLYSSRDVTVFAYYNKVALMPHTFCHQYSLPTYKYRLEIFVFELKEYLGNRFKNVLNALLNTDNNKIPMRHSHVQKTRMFCLLQFLHLLMLDVAQTVQVFLLLIQEDNSLLEGHIQALTDHS